MAVSGETRTDDASREAGREDPRELARLIAASCLPLLFDDGPLITVLLDCDGRIGYANRQFRKLAGAEDKADLIGQNVGEALGCIHSREAAGGCGEAAACAFCGAMHRVTMALGVLDSFDPDSPGKSAPNGRPAPNGQPGMLDILNARGEGEECNIARAPERGEGWAGESSIDLRVWSQAIQLEGRGLVLITAKDISAEKRREVLERIFYHDIANTASGMRTILELIRVVDEEPQERYIALLKSAADQLVEEIESQRALKAAESHELAVRFEFLDGLRMLEEVISLFAYKLEGKDIHLRVAPGSAHLAVESDPTLLRRVLVNMVKNAIEAAVRGEILLAGLAAEEGREGEPGWAVFWVKNSIVMPEVAQRRIFHRSFSTKGPGRGVGTYSMRLLGEGYLKGRVSFSSRPGLGTIFELRIPLA